MHFGVPCYIVNLNFCLFWLKNACFCKLLTSRLLGTTHMIKIFPIKPHKEFVFRKNYTIYGFSGKFAHVTSWHPFINKHPKLILICIVYMDHQQTLNDCDIVLKEHLQDNGLGQLNLSLFEREMLWE